MKVPTLLFLLVCPGLAGEYAVLTNGSRLHVDRHESDGTRVVLYSGSGSMTLAAAEVASFEVEEYVAPPRALQAPPAASVKAPPAPLDPKALVTAAARKTAIPEKLLHSLVAAESAYHTDAVSPKGAVGLMQLMPDTANAYGANAKDPVQNVEAGAAYLRDLLIKYDGNVTLALAAYNAGPGAVEKYHGVPPYAETRAYVGKVIRNWQNRPQAEPAQ
jgi:soluble lytic murein transglycosylase-like protein